MYIFSIYLYFIPRDCEKQHFDLPVCITPTEDKVDF